VERALQRASSAQKSENVVESQKGENKLKIKNGHQKGTLMLLLCLFALLFTAPVKGQTVVIQQSQPKCTVYPASARVVILLFILGFLLIILGATTTGTYIEDVRNHSQNWKAQPKQCRRFFHKLYVGERRSRIL